MIKRFISDQIEQALLQYRCVTLVGPRQSGKTTLSQILGKNEFLYFNFENPETREIFRNDPNGFFNSIKKSAIFDEVQKIPEILSYLQIILDNSNDYRRFILTGSNNLQLSDQVSQSLAGRTRIFDIMPLSYGELNKNYSDFSFDDFIFSGGYPRIFQQKLKPNEWLQDYYRTYIEKDVRQTLNVKDLDQFSRFVRLCAGRCGQVLSMSSLSNDVGVSVPTIKEWLSVLQASYCCFQLKPYFKNYSKRLIKSSKLYFYDTGLLCYLLQISNAEQLQTHPLLGLIFENAVIVEIMKSYYQKGLIPPIYFWRDQHGHEIDLIIEGSGIVYPIEIKYSQTFHGSLIESLSWFSNLAETNGGLLLFRGEKALSVKNIKIENLESIIKTYGPDVLDKIV